MQRISPLISQAILLVLLTGCNDQSTDPEPNVIYRQHMRDLVQSISDYAQGFDPNFILIPQNGHELLTDSGDYTGTPVADYINAIDGVGREDLFYGYVQNNTATPESEINYMIAFMNIAEENGVEVLVTDYCSTPSLVDDSYAKNAAHDFISFAADHRELDDIPAYPSSPYNENVNNAQNLTEASNFLYLLDPGSYTSKVDFLNAIRETNYDVLILDLFYSGTESLTLEDVNSLKIKANGSLRLVIAYMSIGEAEDYRYYWQADWDTNPPPWLVGENPNWPGNYKVRYWDEAWQDIIYGNNDSYLKKIFDAGFDGTYLDIIDAFEYFEE